MAVGDWKLILYLHIGAYFGGSDRKMAEPTLKVWSIPSIELCRSDENDSSAGVNQSITGRWLSKGHESSK